MHNTTPQPTPIACSRDTGGDVPYGRVTDARGLTQ
jgi:hypothetical protein